MELKFILEAILFSAQKPLSPKELKEVLTNAAKEEGEESSAKKFARAKESEIVQTLESLAREHREAARSYRLDCVAGAWQFVTEPEFAPWLRALVGRKSRPPRLSPPALETLAIIAYRQPITRSEMEQIRGVSVDGVVQTLLERGLIEQCGRAEVIGRPALYATTALFLDYFGLGSLDDLPDAPELRRILVEKPEELKTVEAGLATAPPDDLRQEDAESADEDPEDQPSASSEEEISESEAGSDAEDPEDVRSSEEEFEDTPDEPVESQKSPEEADSRDLVPESNGEPKSRPE